MEIPNGKSALCHALMFRHSLVAPRWAPSCRGLCMYDTKLRTTNVLARIDREITITPLIRQRDLIKTEAERVEI